MNTSRCLAISASVVSSFFNSNWKPKCKVDISFEQVIRWHPPHQYVIKLNLDGSVTLERVDVAFVSRNYEGQFIGTGAFNLDGVTISMTEAMGLREGLRLAKRKGFKTFLWKEIQS